MYEVSVIAIRPWSHNEAMCRASNTVNRETRLLPRRPSCRLQPRRTRGAETALSSRPTRPSKEVLRPLQRRLIRCIERRRVNLVTHPERGEVSRHQPAPAHGGSTMRPLMATLEEKMNPQTVELQPDLYVIAAGDLCHIADGSGVRAYCGWTTPRHPDEWIIYGDHAICPGCGYPTCPRCATLFDLERRAQAGVESEEAK
jgi:hypothetical protein